MNLNTTSQSNFHTFPIDSNLLKVIFLSRYHLKDVIVGKIYFLLVRIKIRHMEVAIIKRETTGSGPNTFHDNETIAK